MQLEYIIVQAGGKGTRLGELTKNKPKAMVPVDNKPMIFHLFNKFPKVKYIVIGDYKSEVLDKYLKAFSNVEYKFIKTSNSGTCAGIKEAIEIVPDNTAFMIIWSDLILSDEFSSGLINTNFNQLGISKDFVCRWMYSNNIFTEQRSKDQGVAGLFVFRNKNNIIDVPESGEFVRWLRDKSIKFKELPLHGVKEVGVLEEYNKVESSEFRCRPFNKLLIDKNVLTKVPLDEQGEKLAVKEQNWYKYIIKNNFESIPNIYSYNPLKMEFIEGKAIFKNDLNIAEKKQILTNIVNALNCIHNFKKVNVDEESVYENYYTKTLARLEKVKNLVPFANDEYININGKKCRNIFYNIKKFEDKVKKLLETDFTVIHGDCTFSNILLNDKLSPIFIDPRGYFGNVEIFGDVDYDWAKLYYSIKGNYDQFNNKRFVLDILDDRVYLNIQSNGWENLEETFFDLIGQYKKEKIKFMHAIIWLSLTTYAWEDYDSICGAFYNGTYLMEDCYDKLF